MMKPIYMPINGKFEFMQLPYSDDALKVISSQTLSFHHGKHYRTYLDNLNNLLDGNPLQSKSLFEVVYRSEGALFNNAGQVLNHMLYFEQFGCYHHSMSPDVAQLLERDFGSVESFMQQFQAQALSLFGSGWIWLSQNHDGKLLITQEFNAGNPVKKRLKPLLTFDLWEHAYYLDYQNRRADYLAALWPIIDWHVVQQRLAM